MGRATIQPAHQAWFYILQDRRTLRRTLKLIQSIPQLDEFCLFGRRRPVKADRYLERRARGRPELQLPIDILAVDFDGTCARPCQGKFPLHAATRDVSLRGLGFTHSNWFEGQFALVIFPQLDAQPLSLLMDIRWSNRELGCTLTSGGQFVGVVQQT